MKTKTITGWQLPLKYLSTKNWVYTTKKEANYWFKVFIKNKPDDLTAKKIKITIEEI